MKFYQHFDHQEIQSCIFLVNLIYLNSLRFIYASGKGKVVWYLITVMQKKKNLEDISIFILNSGRKKLFKTKKEAHF